MPCKSPIRRAVKAHKRKSRLRGYDVGVWDTDDDQGLLRACIIARNQIEAKKLVSKYMRKHHSGIKRYSFDVVTEKAAGVEAVKVPPGRKSARILKVY